MILGSVIGKVNTNEFSFKVDRDVKKFDYVQVHHPEYDYVLCQIVDIEKTEKQTKGKCSVLGYKDKNGKLRRPRSPFNPGSEVLLAEKEFIESALGSEESAFIGKLQGQDIDVHLNLNKVLTKHLAVLAKSGSGKSYTVGVLIEEISKQGIPMIVIDPHGEYSSMSRKNEEEIEAMARFKVEPECFDVIEYGDSSVCKDAIPLRLPGELTTQELIHLLPKLNSNQLGLIYNSLKDRKSTTLPELLLELEKEENNAKWSLINVIGHVHGLEIFSESAPPYQELLKPGAITAINLKGFSPDVQEIVVYKLCQDMFHLRKRNRLPPFFMIIEEAHNYCPERSFGESKSSKIIRTIASEGRKFGLGLCVISQRPARVDKSVLSQCSTQIIQKITNPHDLKAVGNSVEGLTQNVEKEIQNLPIGTALVTGISELPLFVNVRPRKSSHGGRSVEMVKQADFESNTEDFKNQELLPIVMPKITKKDREIMDDQKLKTQLIPCLLFSCDEKGYKYKILVDLVDASVVVDIDDYSTLKLPDLRGLNSNSITLLRKAHKMRRFGKDVAQGYADQLVERGLLRETHDQYVISDDHAFQKLSSYEIFSNIDYARIPYDEKLELMYQAEDIKALIGSFTKVLEAMDCFAVRYV